MGWHTAKVGGGWAAGIGHRIVALLHTVHPHNMHRNTSIVKISIHAQILRVRYYSLIIIRMGTGVAQPLLQALLAYAPTHPFPPRTNSAHRQVMLHFHVLAFVRDEWKPSVR